MTSKKRKYGDLSARQPPTSDPSLLDDVFAAFTGRKPMADDATLTSESSTVEPIPDQTRTSALPVPKSDQNSTKSIQSTAPERDFNRRANSLEREALPAGLFSSSSKKIYDALYFRTRGAVKPVRTVQATRRDIMQWTGIKNVKTIHEHTRRLLRAGLIHVAKLSGDHEGSVYEVFLPEEVNQYQTTTSTEVVPDPYQKLVRDQYQKLVRVGMGNPIENKGTYEFPKTFFKTKDENDDDDAALGALCAAERELTGKVSSPEKWAEVLELLAAELRIAAARTTISSAPAFLAEHLRRRLWKKDKSQLAAETHPGAGKGPETPSHKEISKCPDCGGSGFFYPNGFEAGVSKCRHERLAPTTDEQQPS